jgi:hypothetical protein
MRRIQFHVLRASDIRDKEFTIGRRRRRIVRAGNHQAGKVDVLKIAAKIRIANRAAASSITRGVRGL